MEKDLVITLLCVLLEIVKDPEFILGGASRTDVCQGDLGDCWLLAAIASLTLNEKVLHRVVPPDQSFGSGYAGIFHFQFWQHNEWLDVVIDDRLPTFRNRLVFLHSADLNEFWSALLEKAYANPGVKQLILANAILQQGIEEQTHENAYLMQMQPETNRMLAAQLAKVTKEAESDRRTLTELIQQLAIEGQEGLSVATETNEQPEGLKAEPMEAEEGDCDSEDEENEGTEDKEDEKEVGNLQRGLAYQYNSEHNSAISHFTQCTEVLEERVALLSEQLENAANESTEKIQKEMGELKRLLPDNGEKMKESKEAHESISVSKKVWEDFSKLSEVKMEEGVATSVDVKAEKITSSAETEAKTPQGLVKGHAYSITGLDVVNYRGQKVQLIRVRNPWGQVEWNGAWSDNSPEWSSIDPAERKRLCQTSLDDGEFWMKFEDFKRYFDKVEICNLTPDALDDDRDHKWEVTVHQGSWVRGSTAGGCRNFLETFWTNPQIMLSLKETDDGHNDCTIIAALMQKNRRKLKKVGADLLTIGYTIYQIVVRKSVKSEWNHSWATDPWEIEGDINVDIPDPPKPNPPHKETEEERQFRTLFEQIAGDDMEISVDELQYVLNAVLQKSKNIKFKELSLLTCLNIISLMDVSFENFSVFFLKQSINIFVQHDRDKSGTMSSYELRLALKAAGFQLNNTVLQLIVLRYADDQYQIEFDDFLNCLIRLENSYRVFKSLNSNTTDSISVNQAEFISLAMNI
ncbi:calpain-9 [Pyxicephalus adspersus]|uniref:calpain-9 n=1 Tax=Pyxicephalus adspersus TaxID=30357 RepID=UPI003B59D70E